MCSTKCEPYKLTLLRFLFQHLIKKGTKGRNDKVGQSVFINKYLDQYKKEIFFELSVKCLWSLRR